MTVKRRADGSRFNCSGARQRSRSLILFEAEKQEKTAESRLCPQRRQKNMEAFSSFITSLENWIWGAPMLILLCGTHIFMTLRTGYPEKDVHRHPAVGDEGPGLPGRRQPVSGADDRARVHHRHGQHHRRRHGHLSRRPGRGAVVLADRRVRASRPSTRRA